MLNVGCLLSKVKTAPEKVQTGHCTCYRYLTSSEQILKKISKKVEVNRIKCSMDLPFDICFHSFTGIFLTEEVLVDSPYSIKVTVATRSSLLKW